MAKLDRKDIKIFGNDNATDQIVQFGSTRSGSINPSKDPDVLQGLSNYLQGWSEGVIASTGVPPFEEFNALQYLITRELSYLQQAGFPEYSATTEYFIGKSIVREPEGTKLYISLTDNNIGNPLTDMVNWQLLGNLADLNNLAPATELIAGIIRIATSAEANGSTNDSAAITPLKLHNRTATESRRGIAEIATQTEANGSTDDERIITPLKLHNRTATTSRRGVAELATQIEVDAGDTLKIVTGKTLKGAFSKSFGSATSGHEILPDGTIIQYGRGDSSNTIYNFSIPFPTLVRSLVFGSIEWSGGSNNGIPRSQPPTLTGFLYSSALESNTDFHYIAIGR